MSWTQLIEHGFGVDEIGSVEALANGMVFRLHFDSVYPREGITRAHQSRRRDPNRSDTLQPLYARGDF